MKWKCKDCRKEKKLTRHSEMGGHRPPYIMLCEECHQKRHGNVKRKVQYNQKVQRGVKYRKRKLK